MAILHKTTKDKFKPYYKVTSNCYLDYDIARIRKITREAFPLMVFDGNKLYIVKPFDVGLWSKTEAVKDSNEIAAAILLPIRKGES